MNINNSSIFSQFNKMSYQYPKKNADTNVVKVNTQGISGMCIHGKDPSEYRQIIDISDESKQKLFKMTKSEFIQNNGVLNGDTTKKTKVISDYLRSIPEQDRLKGAWSWQQLESQYRAEFIATVKQSNPEWDLGKPFNSSVFQGINIHNTTVDKQTNNGLDIRV